MEVSDLPQPLINVGESLKELETWKEKAILAEKQKALILSKLTADQERRTWEEELAKLKELDVQKTESMMTRKEEYQRKLHMENEQNNKLRRNIQILKNELVAKSAKCEELAKRLQLKKCLPVKKLKFTKLEKAVNEDMYINIDYVVHLTTKIPLQLSQGEALVTFEEENVAQDLIKKHHHTLSLDNKKVILRALPVALDMGMTFQLRAKISQTRITVSNIPYLPIPEDWMRDKLELNFCKSKMGGGEVRNISYDQQSQTALITFLQPGVANNFLKCAGYPFHTVGSSHMLIVSPVIQQHLEGFQLFSGVSKRTILLTKIKEEEEDEESMQDMIAIHFQKPSTGGGEVENVCYVSKGIKFAYFERDRECSISA